MKLKTSIIIPTYNRNSLLTRTLDSFLSQDFHMEGFEVIVVDDGSFPPAFNVVRKYMNKLNLKYHFQEDRGYRVSRARNIGIEHSQGEILIFLDSGMVALPNFISSHAALHSTDNDRAVIGFSFGTEEFGATYTSQEGSVQNSVSFLYH